MKTALFSLMLRLVCGLLAITLYATGVWAKPTTPEQARRVVQNWFKQPASLMNSRLGRQIKEVNTFRDETGAPAYYVVHLNPAGLVFLPADDMVEPIIGFASGATSFDPSPKNPLGALVNGDIPGRVLEARETEARSRESMTPLAPESHWAKSRRKWDLLSNPAPDLDIPGSDSGPTDIRVPPLVQSQWNQAGSDGSYPPNCNNPCYNYYTPRYFPGSADNYVCGCPATAMSQLLRYWQYPAAPIPGTFNITIDGSASTRAIQGGSLPGGGYDWANMVLAPADTWVNLTQRQAIGALTADAGVSVSTAYAQRESSIKDLASLVPALKNTFSYNNAICGSTMEVSFWDFGELVYSSIPLPILYKMVNPNLDAQYPVLFAIVATIIVDYERRDVGHVIVGDGYGFDGWGDDASVMFHHLNMGWSGQDDIWYILPGIYAKSREIRFHSVAQCVYNVYKTGTGEIISGRVTDSAGNPLSGVTVTATATAWGQTYPAMQKDVVAPTTISGVYAIPKVPSGTTFTVTASKPGYTFTPRSVKTGTSTTATVEYHPSTETGNQWGIDFVADKIKGKITGLLLLLLD